MRPPKAPLLAQGLFTGIYVCPRCAARATSRRGRATFSTSRRCRQQAGQAQLPAAPPPSGYARLTSRSLLSVTGRDTTKFLHGLLTSSVLGNGGGGGGSAAAGSYSSFLTAQGRVLFDVFLYPTAGSSAVTSAGGVVATADAGEEGSGFLVEVDAEERDALMRHLKRHKLRSKVKLRAVDDGELDVYAVWRKGERWNAYGLAAQQGWDKEREREREGKGAEAALELVDQRAPGMGRRLLLGPSSRAGGPAATEAPLEGLAEASAEQYAIRRYLKGVPEGQREVHREQSLPMAVNLDLMGAVDFRKGCYVGQELTIRTHHTGVVRRRVLPVQLYDGDTPPTTHGYDPAWAAGAAPVADAEIVVRGARGKPGKWIAGVGNVGLALCRLEMMTDLAVTNEPVTYDPANRFEIAMGGDGAAAVGVTAFVPDWMRGKIRAPKVQKRVE